MICIKVGSDITLKGSFELLKEANALHIACMKG